MRRYVIEREIPEVGTFEREQLRAAAAKSNEVLAELAPNIQASRFKSQVNSAKLPILPHPK